MPPVIDSKAPEQHARVSGSPGEAPRLAGLLRIGLPVFLIMAAAGYLLRAALPWPAMSPTTAGIGFLLLALTLAASIAVSRRRLQAFVKGARGEEWVARILGFLPASHRVFNAVYPSGVKGFAGSPDVDHVVVGPTGVFAIETKHWSGRITVDDGRIRYDGREPTRSPLDQALAGAHALREALAAAGGAPVDVQPVVCFAGGNLAGGRLGLAGVIVCDDRTLIDTLCDPVDRHLDDATQANLVSVIETMMA